MATNSSIIPPEANTEIIESNGSSRVEIIKCKYTWTIGNFSNRLEENGCSLSSPTFPTGEYHNVLQWQLLIYPKGYDNESENYISLFLESYGDISESPTSIATLKILNFPSKEIIISYKHANSVGIINAGWNRFIEKNVLLNALTDDQLTIFCEILTRKVVSSNDSKDNSELGDDLGSLLKDQDFSDVTFSFGRKQLKAHKAILVARSPAFRAKFSNENKENLNNIVKIVDIKYEVFEELLRFMYTGEVKNLKNVAMDLLVAANKYQMNKLQGICDEAYSMLIEVSIENAVETLIFADKHHAFSLKRVVFNFIRKHSKELMATTGWRQMMKDYPHLFEEAFCAMAKNCVPIYYDK